MKYLSSQLGFLLAGESRANLSALLKYFAFRISGDADHGLRRALSPDHGPHREGQQHSWITGFYWTLVVMTTLGFGDITFTSDVVRGAVAAKGDRSWRFEPNPEEADGG